jgi:prevent-host-death family protein
MSEGKGRYGDDTNATDKDDRQSDSRHVGVAEAKGTFSAMIEGVQHRGERYVIERHGKPAAALVSVEELGIIEARRAPSEQMTGGLRLLGLWRDVPRDAISEVVDHIYAERERDLGREVDTSSWRT